MDDLCNLLCHGRRQFLPDRFGYRTETRDEFAVGRLSGRGEANHAVPLQRSLCRQRLRRQVAAVSGMESFETAGLRHEAGLRDGAL